MKTTIRTLIVCVGCASVACREEGPEPVAKAPPSSAPADADGAAASDALPVLVTIPRFMLADQEGDPFGTPQLRGRIWVANFIFTRCAGTCPTQTAQMRRLQEKLQSHPRGDRIVLVSTSVDPEHDTPEVLKDYGRKAGADLEQWHFLTGTRDAIWELSKDGFKLAVGENPGNAAMPLFHSPKLVLVDPRGRIRGFYDGLTPAGRGALLKDLDRVLTEDVAAPTSTLAPR